jgi:hypothetical protein
LRKLTYLRCSSAVRPAAREMVQSGRKHSDLFRDLR